MFFEVRIMRDDSLASSHGRSGRLAAGPELRDACVFGLHGLACRGGMSMSCVFVKVWQFRWPSDGLATETDS